MLKLKDNEACLADVAAEVCQTELVQQTLEEITRQLRGQYQPEQKMVDGSPRVVVTEGFEHDQQVTSKAGRLEQIVGTQYLTVRFRLAKREVAMIADQKLVVVSVVPLGRFTEDQIFSSSNNFWREGLVVLYQRQEGSPKLLMSVAKVEDDNEYNKRETGYSGSGRLIVTLHAIPDDGTEIIITLNVFNIDRIYSSEIVGIVVDLPDYL